MKVIEVEVFAETPFAVWDDYRVKDVLEMEVEDNATEEEIEKEAEQLTKEWFYDMYNYGWNVKK